MRVEVHFDSRKESMEHRGEGIIISWGIVINTARRSSKGAVSGE